MKKRGLVLLLLLTFTCLVLLVGAAVLSGVAVTQGVTEMRSCQERRELSRNHRDQMSPEARYESPPIGKTVRVGA